MAAITVCHAVGCTNSEDLRKRKIPSGSADARQSIPDDEWKETLGVGSFSAEGAAPDREQSEKAKILYVRDFGAKGDGINNDGSPIRKAITVLRKAESGSRLVFDANTTYYISSGEYALALQSLKDVTIEGKNTTILAKPIMGLCRIQDCTNVVIQGINFDYKTKPYAVADVIADKGDGVVHIQTDRSLNFRGTYSQPTADYFGVVDRIEGRYHVGITSIKVVDSAERIYEVRCNHVFAERDERIRMMTDEGYKFIVPMPNVGQAIEQAFTVIGNEDVTMKDCNIWSAAKFMFFLNGNDGVIKFQNVHITPAPGEDAHIVGWRDGFHCKENRAQLIWENCSAKYLYDDIFNISASMLQVQKAEGNRLHLYWQETGGPYPHIRAGDTVSFFDTASGEQIGSGTVRQTAVFGAETTVILEEPLPGIEARESCKAVVDTLAAPGSIIRNCNFQGTFRFRAPIYISDSRLHVTRMWLNVEAPWEGPVTSRVLFSNCVFTFDNPEEKFIHIGSGNGSWKNAGNPYRVKDIVFFHCRIRRDAVEIGAAESAYDEVCFPDCY